MPANASFITVLRTAVISVISLASTAMAGSNSIYGIQFYGNCGGVGAENIMNGKAGYDLENINVQGMSNWSGIRSQVQAAKNAGFTVIVRMNWANGQTVPANGDWTNRYNFAQQCKACVTAISDLCNIYVIGNEMNLASEGAIPADWYLTCFSNTDGNNCYNQIHIAQSSAIVCIGGVGVHNADTDVAGGPYDHTHERWKNYFWYLVNNAASVDGFSLHNYGGRNLGQWGLSDYDPDPRDDADYPNVQSEPINTDWGFNSLGYWMGEIDTRYANAPVYITETNTYLDASGPPDVSYRAGWMQKSFEAIDTWNKTHYHRINALCWFVYSYGYGWSNFSIMTECRTGTPANLVQARSDYNSTTSANTYVNTQTSPNAYVYQINTGASNLSSVNPYDIVMGNYVGSVNYWTGLDTNWGTGGPAGQTDNWMMVQSRVFYVPTAGTYNFRTTSDDGSWLWVDGQIVVDNHGLHGQQTVTGSKALTWGYHWCYVQFFEATSGSFTGYQYQPPSGSWQTIPEARHPKGNAIIYGLNTGTSNLSSNDMNQIKDSGMIDAFAWNGVAKNWGSGGPAGTTDNYIIAQPFLFYVAVSGTYQFRTGSDDGSWLWIDGQIVVNNYGLHGLTWVGGSKSLVAGWHTGYFKFFESTGGSYSCYDFWPPGAPTNWSPMFVY